MPQRGRDGTRPTVIVFVRHGTTPTTGKLLPGRAPGLHLADQGRTEAQRTAERIAALPAGTVKAVYASTLERAQETAAFIGEAVHLPVIPVPELVDTDTGEWTGMELRAAYKLPAWRELQSRRAGFRFPGGESITELRGRIATAVERIRSENPGSVVVAVSHADPIKLAVAEALGSPLDLSDRIAIAPCSVTVVVYGGEAVSVSAVNSTGDLAALGLGGGNHKSRRGSRRTPGEHAPAKGDGQGAGAPEGQR